MEPMLARTVGPKFAHYPCFIQPKLNGVRALYQSGIFQSRDEHLWNAPVLEHLRSELTTLSNVLGSIVLDGELYVHGWKLQRINGAVSVNRNEPCEDTLKVEYHIFDTIYYHPFSVRWPDVALALTVAELPHIHVVPTDQIYFSEQLEQHFHHWTSLGYEGVMLRPDGPYEHKRSKYLWKHKAWEDGEFECIGITQGEGKADIGIGALVLSRDAAHTTPAYDRGTSFLVGTGFSDEERIEFMENPPIGKLIRVKYNPDLTEKGVPTHASFIAVM